MEMRRHHQTVWWLSSNGNAQNGSRSAIYRRMPHFAVTVARLLFTWPCARMPLKNNGVFNRPEIRPEIPV